MLQKNSSNSLITQLRNLKNSSSEAKSLLNSKDLLMVNHKTELQQYMEARSKMDSHIKAKNIKGIKKKRKCKRRHGLRSIYK